MDEKPGWKTSEFWVMLITAATMFLVAFGVLTQEEADAIIAEGGNLAAALIAFLGVLPVWKYIDSRGKVKASRNEAAGMLAKGGK